MVVSKFDQLSCFLVGFGIFFTLAPARCGEPICPAPWVHLHLLQFLHTALPLLAVDLEGGRLSLCTGQGTPGWLWAGREKAKATGAAPRSSILVLSSTGPEIVMQCGKEGKASSHCTQGVEQVWSSCTTLALPVFPWAGAVIVTSYSAPHPGRKTVSGCPGAAGCLCGRLSQGAAFNTPQSRVIGGNVHFRFLFFFKRLMNIRSALELPSSCVAECQLWV